MLMLLISLAARADAPATPAPAAAAPAAAAPAADAPAPIEIETINLTGAVHVPEVIIFTPRITIQEDSAQTLSERIDAELAEAAEQR